MAATNNNAAERTMSRTTPLVLVWAFATLVWSIFTPPHKTFAARMILFQPAWIVRAVRNDSTWIQDLYLFEIVHTVYSYSIGAWQLNPLEYARKWLDISYPTTLLCIQIFSLLGLCSLLAGSIVYRGGQFKDDEPSHEPLYAQRIDEQILPPLLFASKTTHSRVFPKKHSFNYSYLLVGVPVGTQGCIKNILSVDSERRGWFDVNGADYLHTNNTPMTLAEKLQRYLHTQGITDREYAYAYLITAPRFLGYSFNPVSFWYLYDSDTKLKYMILEVNNTFGERRMYLLRSDSAKLEAGKSAAQMMNSNKEDMANSLVFSETWEKDFHVSPFNSRKGTYSLKAIDPLAASQDAGRVRIDNTIVLRSSKEHAKLVARVWSEGEPQDPNHMSVLQTARFVFAWSWVGFATFPRIAFEAGKLFFKRKLHVWYRPEVTPTSMGRAYTEDEQDLEVFFQAFLAKAVNKAGKPLRVIYERAHSQDFETILYSPGYTYEEDHKRTLKIKVLSPAFYSRFVHYAHVKEAFDRECLATESKSRTAHIEHPDLLPDFLAAIKRMSEAEDLRHSNLSYAEQIRWAWLRRLRCPPAASAYPDNLSVHITDIRNFGHSELDRFVMRNREDSDDYRRITTKLFLAERFAFGIPALIGMMDMLVRASLLCAAMVYSNHHHAADILRPRKLVSSDLPEVLVAIGLANAVHLWGWIRG